MSLSRRWGFQDQSYSSGLVFGKPRIRVPSFHCLRLRINSILSNLFSTLRFAPMEPDPFKLGCCDIIFWFQCVTVASSINPAPDPILRPLYGLAGFRQVSQDGYHNEIQMQGRKFFRVALNFPSWVTQSIKSGCFQFSFIACYSGILVVLLIVFLIGSDRI